MQISFYLHDNKHFNYSIYEIIFYKLHLFHYELHGIYLQVLYYAL